MNKLKIILRVMIYVFSWSFLSGSPLLGASENMAPNPSFEFGASKSSVPGGWRYQQNFISPDATGDAFGTWESDGFKGRRSISITEGRWFSASQWGCQVRGVEANTYYLFSLQTKRDSNTGWLPKVRLFDQSRVINVKKSGSYQYFEFLFYSGPVKGSTELSMIVYKKPSKIWFDDLRLVKFTVKPQTPCFNERIDNSKIYFSWSVPENGQALMYEVQIYPEGSKSPEFIWEGIAENYYRGPVLNPGKYSWKVEAYSGRVLLAESKLQPFEVVAGEKEFPVGISGLPPGKAREAIISGFNWVFMPADPLPYLAAGMRIISPVPSSAICYLYDEPEQSGVLPRAVREKHGLAKQADPEKPTAITVYDPDRYLEYAGTADILMVDPYPVPVRPLKSVPEAVLAARAVRGGEPVWAIIQAFDWKEFSPEAAREGIARLPTPAEVKAMAYLAIAAGAKGLVFYTGGQPKVYQSNLFRELKKLAVELRKQNGFLTFPSGESRIEPPFYILEKKIPGKGICRLVVNSEPEPARFGAELIEAYGVRLQRIKTP
ncbi:MAG: hypothetical protein NTY10_01860 [Candidatus Omnitrophica bacterium]|nr:hypothetical protein [Candidatus Omnitrophota bacterium]